MFLRAGALSLALLVASRLLGLLRESAQAAAFGASGMGDVAVLMLTLPDWLASVLAGGALAYAMLPAWAAQSPATIQTGQRRLARMLLGAGVVLAIALAVLREPAIDLLAPGLGPQLREPAARALLWSAAAVPLALLAALGATRLQHEREFAGMYGANLVVNGVLVAVLALLAAASGVMPQRALAFLGWGLLGAMALRLAWLHLRQRPFRLARSLPPAAAGALPTPGAWMWAALAAGLPLVLPFAARSIASASGEGALATFNYAWKLVELPLLLAIQLVATLAFPAVARAFAASATSGGQAVADAVRPAFALAWTFACAAAAGLLLASPALAQLLFGWGRMDNQALSRVAQWGAIGAWGLLPQALIAVALTALAAQRRMRAAVLAYVLALAGLLLAAAAGVADGARLMAWLNGLLAGVALLVLASLGRDALRWLPWPAVAAGALALAGAALAVQFGWTRGWSLAAQLAAGVLAAAAVTASTLAASADLRNALRR